MQGTGIVESEIPIRFFREFWDAPTAEPVLPPSRGRHVAERGAIAPQSRESALLADYLAVRRQTESLTAPLSAEDQNIQSMPDASPTKWHLAHTTWFFEAVILSKFVPGYEAYDAAYGYLFNSYYEGLGRHLPRDRRGLISRPTVPEVMKYRSHVDTAMCALIETRGAEIRELAALGLHHEQQHQELLLTDIKHAFFSNPLRPAYSEEFGRRACRKAQSWLGHNGGIVEIGYCGSKFSFDNESPRHKAFLQPFRIADRPVSNSEYREFIDDGGYRRPELWLSDGWAMVQRDDITAPLYWIYDHGDWSVFTLAGVRPFDADAPVSHVSFYEAAAYATWANMRLPTEFEWEAANPKSQGLVWEWTRSAYEPYPGYRPFTGDVAEYNGKFMSGQMVLRGGSHATPAGHVRRTYRNFFPPSARWQFSGIRLASEP